MKAFPRTEVAGISLPRILIGSNWMLGFSHTSTSADKMIKNRFGKREAVSEILEAYLEYDINAIMAPFYGNDVLVEGIRLAEDRTGKKIIMIDTPIIDVHDSKESRASASRVIAAGRKAGSDFCLIHHSCAEQLVSKLKGTLDRLPDYTDMIRENDMVPGLSAHMPELIQYSDENEYDVQTYIQLYNPVGFLMQIEVEGVSRIIWNAKKPVMTIKSMAAGRVSPYVGITFAFSTLRPCDMVTIGAHTVDEVHEDVEIGFAALERRPPRLEGRSSPNKTKLLGGE
jgi:hypothetical protein